MSDNTKMPTAYPKCDGGHSVKATLDTVALDSIAWNYSSSLSCDSQIIFSSWESLHLAEFYLFGVRFGVKKVKKLVRFCFWLQHLDLL